jgi:hypothetical protein
MNTQQGTGADSRQERTLIEKIRTLPPHKVAEVEDFVDFLSQKTADQALLAASNKLAEKSFRKVWDNPEDEVYDRL